MIGMKELLEKLYDDEERFKLECERDPNLKKWVADYVGYRGEYPQRDNAQWQMESLRD